MRIIAATLTLALIPASSFAADMPQIKPSAPIELPRCHSPFPAPFTLWWPCDPMRISAGTNDHSQPHAPGTISTPSKPSGPPSGGGDDGCGDKGGRHGR